MTQFIFSLCVLFFSCFFFHTFAITSPIRRLEKNKTIVLGYEETFNGPLFSNWESLYGPSYQIFNGTLQVYGGESYGGLLFNSTVKLSNEYQDVTMKFRVKHFQAGNARGGAFGVVVFSSTTGACLNVDVKVAAINLVFEANNGKDWEVAGGVPTFGLLHDCIHRNPNFFVTNSTNFPVYPTENPLTSNQWYWMRIGYYPNQPFNGGTLLFNSQNDVFGKIWSDTQLEPDWQLGYDYGGRTPASGLPGITCYNLTGNASIEVDYILIQAPELPQIIVSESSNGITPLPAAYQPLELNKLIKGFQDTFTNSDWKKNWWIDGPDIATHLGYLRFPSKDQPNSDLTHLAYNFSFESGQDVTIKFRVYWVNDKPPFGGTFGLFTSWNGFSDQRSSGIRIGTEIQRSLLVLSADGKDRVHFPFLTSDPLFPVIPPENPYATGKWYWMRIGIYQNQSFDGVDILFNGENDVFGKIWSDNQEEPAWQFAWDLKKPGVLNGGGQLEEKIRPGWAGIYSGGGLDVAQVLIQAPNLRPISRSPVLDNNDSQQKMVLLLSIIIPVVVVLLVIVGVLVWRVRQKNDFLGYYQKQFERQSRFSNIEEDQLHFEKIIGQGHFGKVWRGMLRETATVAIKELKSSHGLNSSEFENFIHEAKLVCSFPQHPNIVSLLGICISETKKTIFIVTEYIHRGSLQHFLFGRVDLPMEMLLSGAKGVAAGMQHLAYFHVIHNDLAARNVLVVVEEGSPNNTLIAKVTDFGLATEKMGGGSKSSKRSLPLRWIAPELFSDKGRPSQKSDVWSFGVLLWEIFTHCTQLPYGSLSHRQLEQKIKGGYRLACPPRCPELIYQVMLKCWRSDATTRPDFYEIFHLLPNPKDGDELVKTCNSIVFEKEKHTITMVNTQEMLVVPLLPTADVTYQTELQEYLAYSDPSSYQFQN